MNKAQAPQSSTRCADGVQLGNHDAVKGTDNEGFNLTGAMNKQSDLPVHLMRQLADSSRDLGWYDQITPDFSAGKPLKNFELILFQAFKITCYISYGVFSLCAVSSTSGKRSADAPSRLQTLLWV